MLPPKVSCPNKVFPQLSTSLNIAYKEELGRHVVATRNIRAGEIVAVEDPEISFLKFDERGSTKFGSVCTNCLMRNVDCLPSPINNSVYSYIKNTKCEYSIINSYFLQLMILFYDNFRTYSVLKHV